MLPLGKEHAAAASFDKKKKLPGWALVNYLSIFVHGGWGTCPMAVEKLLKFEDSRYSSMAVGEVSRYSSMAVGEELSLEQEVQSLVL